jgi:hypothetical protein
MTHFSCNRIEFQTETKLKQSRIPFRDEQLRFTFVPSIAIVALEAISLAISIARSRHSAFPTTISDKKPPISLASRLSKNLPVKQISLTQDSFRQIRGRKNKDPQSAQIPILISRTEKRHVSVAIRISHALAISIPKPIHKPSIAQTTGRGNDDMARIGDCIFRIIRSI